MSSGSGDLWVADRQGGYQASQSSTYRLVNSSWEIRYDSNVGAYVPLKVSLMIDLGIGEQRKSRCRADWSWKMCYSEMRLVPDKDQDSWESGIYFL